MNVTSRVRLAAAICLGVSISGSAAVGWGHPRWWALPVLTVAVVLSERSIVNLSFGRQRWGLSLTEGVIGAAFVFAPGAWPVFAVALGSGIALTTRRRPRLKIEYNVAQFAASMAAAAVVDAWIGGGMVGAVVAMAMFWVVNYLLVGLVISLTSTQQLREVLASSGPLSGVHSAGNTSIGLLAAWLTLHAPLGLLGLVVPVGLLWVSYDQQTRQAFEAKMFAELATGQERVSGRSLDLSARVVLTTAARLFGGDAEMVLLTGDGPVRYTGHEASVSRERVESDAFDRPWVLRALGARGLVTGMDAGRPYCSAVLGDVDHPMAVLIARRLDGAMPFDRREQALAGVLVRQAESWLSVAELTASRDDALVRAEAAGEAARALGDLGAHTWPAMLTLRESAARLARLATMPEGSDPVGEIVGELHAAERAVASLLGAIALAADPELAGSGAPRHEAIALPAARSPEKDTWTTTGVLEPEGAEASS